MAEFNISEMLPKSEIVEADVYDIGESDRGHDAFVDAMHQRLSRFIRLQIIRDMEFGGIDEKEKTENNFSYDSGSAAYSVRGYIVFYRYAGI